MPPILPLYRVSDEAGRACLNILGRRNQPARKPQNFRIVSQSSFLHQTALYNFFGVERHQPGSPADVSEALDFYEAHKEEVDLHIRLEDQIERGHAGGETSS